MNTEKPTILIFPSWWPTDANPMNGVFFKEQMEALSIKYNFLVFLYRRKRIFSLLYLGRVIIGRTTKLEKQIELDTAKQYTCIIYEPLVSLFSSVLNFLKVKFHLVKLSDGIGEFQNEKYLKKLSKRFSILFKRNHLNIDLVYGLTAQDMAIVTYCAANALNVPYILAEHAPFPWPGKTINNLQKLCIENADANFAISNDKIRQIMLQNIKLKNICYVGNFVNDKIFSYAPIAHEKTTFIIVAANSFYKNYDMFIETMNELSEIASKDFAVVVAGFGANKGYSKNADELIKRIKLSKFADKAELLPIVPRNEMPSLLNRCDAFVMTSIQEGQPVSAIEAACCGLPIFSTCCGGVEDYVYEDIGRIVSITDSKLLASYLNDFLDGKINFNNRHIREVVISKFGQTAFVSNLSKVFDELIDDCNKCKIG